MVLPAVALGVGSLAVLARMTRSAMLEILNEDYILAARSYGLSEGTVLWKLALKNSLGPTATITALVLGWMLVNTFLVEAIFNWPGIGSYIANAIPALDFPAIIGVTLFSAVAYVILNTAADIVVAIDPRVRL
jgi:peptide/nickel transport system permease protein